LWGEYTFVVVVLMLLLFNLLLFMSLAKKCKERVPFFHPEAEYYATSEIAKEKIFAENLLE
jgi:hypothetical protein